jgi:hypothetical protein
MTHEQPGSTSIESRHLLPKSGATGAEGDVGRHFRLVHHRSVGVVAGLGEQWEVGVDRAAHTSTRAVPPLAVGPYVLKAGEKSPVTGDCHAGICGSPGVRFPLATRPRSLNEGTKLSHPLCMVAGEGVKR